MKQYSLTALARQEFYDKLDYLKEEAGIEVAKDFRRHFDEVVSRICLFPRIAKVAVPPNFRRWPIPKYHVWVVYVELPNEIRIRAVANMRRKPNHWLDR